MLETYKCNNCNKKIEKIKRFETFDIDYREIINDEYDQLGNSFASIDMDNFLEYFFLNKRLTKKKKKMEECPSCKNKVEINNRKILEYPSYLIIRLKIGDYEEKKGFTNMKDKIPSFNIKLKEIKNMEIYISDLVKMNKTNNKYEYELLSMICYLKDDNKIKFISTCKNISVNNEVWIYFMCNIKAKTFKNYKKLIDYLTENEAQPYILFYELKKK